MFSLSLSQNFCGSFGRRGYFTFCFFLSSAIFLFSSYIAQGRLNTPQPGTFRSADNHKDNPFACRSVRGYAFAFQIAPHVSSTATTSSSSFSMVSVHPPIYQLHRALRPDVPSGVSGTDKMRSTQDWVMIAKGPESVGRARVRSRFWRKYYMRRQDISGGTYTVDV